VKLAPARISAVHRLPLCACGEAWGSAFLKRFVKPYFRARQKDARDEGKPELPVQSSLMYMSKVTLPRTLS